MLKKFMKNKPNINLNNLESLRLKHKSVRYAIKDAEKLVGSPGKYFNIRNELMSSFSNISGKRNDFAIENPLFKGILKDLTSKQDCDIQSFGLIILLIAQMGNEGKIFDNFDKKHCVQEEQKILAECIESQRLSFTVHEAIKNYQLMPQHGNEFYENSNEMKTQKLTLLGGDILMARSMHKIFEFRDSDGSGDISRAVRNYIESQFIGDRDSESFPLPSNPNLKMECEFVTEEDKNLDGVEDKKSLSMSRIFGHPKREWIYRNVMSTGSMLGAFSKWSMKFSKASSQHQNSAYNFGKNYALTVNAFTQLLPFIEPQKFNGNKFCLVSAPVLFQLDETPVMYEEIVKGRDSIENIDYDKLYRMITDGCGIERTKELLVEFSVNALYELGNFKSSKSKDALENIIISMMEAQKVFS